jgi:hypothetical protein
MTDEGTMVTDVMATPEQVLAAGGVSKRRRGASSSKRRSPSGQRRRAATPEPPKDVLVDPDEEMQLNSQVLPAVRRSSTAEKALMMKRSHSSPGEGRQSLPSTFTQGETGPKATEQITDFSPTIVTKRKSTTEKALMTKRSHSSPGEGRQKLPLSPNTTQEPGVVAAPRRKHLSDDTSSALRGTSEAVRTSDQDSLKRSEDTFPESINRHAEGVHVESVVPEYETLPSPADTSRVDVADGSSSVPTAQVHKKPIREAVWGPFLRDTRHEWKKFLNEHSNQWGKIIAQRNRCAGALVVVFVYCGLGGLVFRFTEGAFEAFYKCGVKRVKRDFVDSLWLGSHHLLEDEWKSQARRKLMELETQLLAAHEAGVTTYSGQRAWSFLNAVVYCLTVVTTIGKGAALSNYIMPPVSA